MIRVEFWGNQKFLRRTETVRNDLKDRGEFAVEEVCLDGRPNEGQIMIRASEPNEAGLQEGIIKVVDREPAYVEKFEPVEIGNGAYIDGITLSIHRRTLEQDIWELVNNYKTSSV